MIKLDPMNPEHHAVLQSMVRLRADTRLQPFMAWLERSLMQSSLDNNRETSEQDRLRRAGANVLLEDIINAINTAQDILESGEQSAEKSQAAGAAFS